LIPLDDERRWFRYHHLFADLLRNRSLQGSLPAVLSPSKPWLPKEIKLAEIVRYNMGQGRKTLTFVEQTGTRDIRDRLKEVLENLAPGGGMTLVEVPKVGILSAGDMSPARREGWIKGGSPARMTGLPIGLDRLFALGLATAPPIAIFVAEPGASIFLPAFHLDIVDRAPAAVVAAI